MQSIIPALAVADMEASIRFYTEVLGFSVTTTLPGPDGKPVHASLQRGEAQIMFGPVDAMSLEHLALEDRTRLGKGVNLYAVVAADEDIDAFFDRVRAAGATILWEPTDQFWGMRDWGVADPDGYLWTISKQTGSPSAAEMEEAMLTGAPAD